MPAIVSDIYKSLDHLYYMLLYEKEYYNILIILLYTHHMQVHINAKGTISNYVLSINVRNILIVM